MLGCLSAAHRTRSLKRSGFVTCSMSNELYGREDGVHVEYRLDGSLFNIRRLQARTKTKTRQICELQYADDCAVLELYAARPRHNIQSVPIFWPTG